MTYQNAKREIIQLGKFLFDKGYVVASDGNISVRNKTNEILITRRGVCKGELKIGDIVKLDIRNQTLAVRNHKIRPSSEYQMHLAIYKNRPDIKSIIHAHPLFTTICAVSRKKLDIKLLTETAETIGKIGYVGYYKPGSLKLAKAVCRASTKSNAMILAHHGVVVLGEDLLEARYRLERLEFLAKVKLFKDLLRSSQQLKIKR